MKIILKKINWLIVGAACLAMTSWMTENFLKSKFSAQKENLFHWMATLNSTWSDNGNWQIAAEWYGQYYKDKFGENSDSLIARGYYVSLCRNWLETYYSSKMAFIEMVETDAELRQTLQKAYVDTVNLLTTYMNNRFYKNIVYLFKKERKNARNSIIGSGWQIGLKLDEIEAKEKMYSKIFLWCYILSSILLGANYLKSNGVIVRDKVRVQHK